MIKYSVVLAALGLSLAATCSFAQETPFERVLNSCLARAGASIIDCARVAGATSEDGRIRVTAEFDPHDPDGSTETEVVGECENDGARGPVCRLYDCREDLDAKQSVCEFIRICMLKDGDCVNPY